MEAVNMKQRWYFRVVIFFLLLHQSTEADDCASAVDSCNAQNLKWKSVPVGVATDAKIPNNKMTSSSNFNTSTPPYNGRLGYTAGPSWCSVTSDSSPHLEIELGASYIILGVATQGDHKSSQWVQTYQIQTSKDGSSFNDYKQNNVAEVFPGNIDSDSTVQNPLFDGVVGRHVRILPKSSFGSTTCMRTELYGVQQDTVCSKIFVDVASSASIPDHRFTASSYYDSKDRYLPSNARLRLNKAWEPANGKQSDSWLHIDLGSLVYICAVATQGNAYSADEYAKKYKLRMSLDNINWQYYKDENGDKVFNGNSDRTTVVTNTLAVPTKAKFVGFYPTDYNVFPAMRVEVYGAPLECSKPFGLEKGGNLGNIGVTASSSSDSSHDAFDGRLYGDASWCSLTSSKSEYIEIDFKKIVTLTGIATQGDHSDNKWVETYILEYSIDGSQWNDYREGGNSAKVFQGNSDKSSIVVRWLNHPTSVRYIRVNPQAWNSDICMRLELFGCPSPSTLKISELSNTNLQASSGRHVTLTCKVQEPLIHSIEWSIDGKDVTGRSAGMTRDATSVKSLLQVNYTNADVFKSTLCSKQGSYMTCRRNVVCKVKYTSSSGDSIQGAEVETKSLELPSTPTLKSVTNILSTSVELNWTMISKTETQANNSFVIKYLSQSNTKTDIASSSPHQSTGLSVCTPYTVSIKAVSVLGEGSWSNTLRFKTKPFQSPSAPPNGITTTSESSQSVLVKWQVPSGLTCPVNGYRINISTSQGGSGKYLVVDGGNTTSRTIPNLDKWTNYYITVEAGNELGYGPGSVPASQRTQEDAPSAPRNIKTTDIASDGSSGPRLKVSWDIPSALNAEYIRKYSLSFKSADGKAITNTTNKTTAILDVHGGVKYTINVWAFTVSNGPKAQKIVITEAYAPPAPTEGVISNINGSVPNVTLWKISAINGPISEILVSVENVQGGKKRRRAIKISIPDCETMASRAFKLDPSQRFFILGDGKTYGENKNKKLIGGKYKVYQCGVTRNKQKKSLYGKTVMIAEVQVPVDHDKSDPQSGNGPGGNNTPLVASLVVVFLIIIIVTIIVGVIFWRRRRSNQANDDLKLNNVDDIERENTNAIEGGDVPPHANAGYAPNGRDDGDADLYGNADAIRHQPIHVNKFSQYVIEKGDSLKADFKLLSSVQIFPWTVAKNPKNKPKNRYANIITYDHSRVVLEDTSNGSDYVNASYIHGFDGTPKTYIATQGPNPVSVPDFWKMVWQENIKTIVMLTNLTEAGKVKCHQYWPDKKEAYGKFIVNLHRTDTMADYVVRVLIVSKDGETESRQVYHFQYTSWPDKGVPEHATSILGFRNKARIQYSSCDSTGPLLVHCSAGVGRTGAFLAIDAMLERVKKEKTIDILSYAQLMRENRCTMIQTEAQYVFVHRALQEAITCGNTEIPVLNLNIAMGKLARPRPKDQQTGYHLEWKRLTAISPKVTNEVSKAGRQQNNRPRNRYQDIIPFDSARVFLAQDHQNYINASFANAFRERNAFIMTQAPLDNTVSDFWLMVHQYKIGSIVMLNKLQEENESFFQYWPKDSSETYNGITVEVINRATNGPLVVTNCILTLVEDQNNPHRFVHIQHTDWPKDGAPNDCQSILDIVDRVQKAQQQSCNAPIAVQCSDGVGRSGTFCAIYSILERVKSEQVVDVFQAIKVLRLGRPNAVATLEQYKFCYRMVQVYLDSFNDYANFSEV